jgi:hypothetical protein
MPAIITDNLKITNCTNFINDVNSGNYYTFIGLSNYTDYATDWNSNTPDPVDNLNYLNEYRNTILSVKKITSSDLIRVIPKVQWTSGLKYDMYRHDYSRYNLTPVTNYTRLYDSKFYVMNKDFRVYICINNGSAPSNNNKGVISVNEPVHTSESPELENDGYMWKYLYTISPADVLKFDSTNYISVPNNWQSSVDVEIRRIRDSSVNGKIESILIERQQPYAIPSNTNVINNVPIVGDGVGGSASVFFDEFGNPINVVVTNGGSDYTFATLDLDSVVNSLGEKAIFNVIIPPPGGHGRNVYTELGANRVLVYSRLENSITNPDFIEGNQFARIGIIKNVLSFDGQSIFQENTGSGVYGVILDDNEGSATNKDEDAIISQSSTKSIGSIVSSVSVGSSTVVKYTKPREFYVDTYSQSTIIKTSDRYLVQGAGLTTSTTYNYSSFDTNDIIISDGSGSSQYSINNFTGSQIGETFLGQNFTSGLSNPDINTKSGEIVYVDNRSSVSRQSQQREDIKIIIEF